MILKLYHHFGFDNEDIEKIKKVDDSFQVYGVKSKDVIIEKNNSNSIVRINEISDNCNKLVIKEGRRPENKNEVLMEYGINDNQNINVGDELEIDGEKIKIVGSALSTDFLIKSKMVDSRGTSSLGSGRVSFCLFAPHDYFDFDYYTSVYIVDDTLSNVNINSDEYAQKIKKDKEKLNEVKGEIEEDKHKRIIEAANKKIDEEETKVKSELDKLKNELDKGKAELDATKEELSNAKKTLDSSKEEIDNAEKLVIEYEQKLKSAKNELDVGKKTLDETKEKLDASKQELDKAEAELNKYERELNSAKLELDNAKKQINEKLSSYNVDYDVILGFINENGVKGKSREELIEIGKSYGLDEVTINFLIDGINAVTEIENGYNKYNENKAQLNNQKANFNTAKAEYDSGLQQYNSGLYKYNSGYNEYIANQNQLKTKKKLLESSKIEYSNGLAKYEESIEKYNEGLSKYTTAEEEFNNKKIEVEDKIKNARKELENIDKAIFYISDREENYEYSTYMSLCRSFDNLSKTFPVIFFLVAVFISFLSMARMAIENRNEIGTLKALGFTNKEIRVKYIIYSLLATIIGGTVGAILGDRALSYLCYYIFNDIYQVPVYESIFNISACVIGNLFSILAIVGATLIVINKLLKEDATSLLRPISPPIGKKILLERIKPLWDKMSFNNKIMARNIFRYKRRVIMSLLGFIGCTSLLIAGYAIKDSMLNIIDKQFNEISDYDEIINLDGKLNENKLKDVFNYDIINKTVFVKTSLVEFQDYRATCIVPNDVNNFKTIFNIKDYKTGETLELKDNEVIITINLAESLNKKAGDVLEYIDSNNILQKFKISAISENYVDNYIYMNKNTYLNNVDGFEINCAFVKFYDLENTEPIIEELNKNEHVLTTLSVEYLVNNFKKMLVVFDSIIVILVIFSALLSFVVMYSLAYITISERQREVATLKVLGYSEKNVDGYILKEQLNILILGIITGIIAGSLYSNILVKNIKFNQLYLVKQIEFASYLKTAGFIILFALIISIGVHFMLKKIKMIESLKSVE